MPKKIKKKFLVSEVNASEIAAVNCLYYEGNAYHGKSMRYETVLRLSMSVREIFYDPIDFVGISKYAKRAVVQISTVVLPAHHAGCQSVL